MCNVDTLLREAGGELADIVKVVITSSTPSQSINPSRAPGYGVAGEA